MSQNEIIQIKHQIEQEERKYRIELTLNQRYDVLKNIKLKINDLYYRLVILEHRPYRGKEFPF